MKSLVSGMMALGFAAALSTAAFADCATQHSAESKSLTPIVTADTVVKTDDKG